MKQLFFTILAMFILNATYGQVKATSSEINAGTDDAKFATALALQGSKYLDQNGAKVSAVTAAGANTYTASIAPALTAYSLGQVFYIKITTANTGASTLNLNGLGAKTLVKDASTALAAGDLLPNKVYAVYYDGTNFQVLNSAAIGTNNQTLSLGTSPGSIGISGGNTVQLASITTNNKSDATIQPAAGLAAYTNTGGSVGYPTVGGGGLAYTRFAGTNSGSFDIWTSSTAYDELLRYRTSATSTTWNPWKIIADRDWVSSQIPGSQTLSLGAAAGNIVISGGNNISLGSLSLKTETDGNVIPTAPGIYGTINTTGSTNYPSLAGGGFTFVRGANLVGALQINQTNLNAAPLFRHGTGTTTWSNWETFASREWANSQFYNQTQTNSGFIKIGTAGGYASADPGVDLNTITTNNVFYIASPSTNKPATAGMIQSFGRNSLYSSQMMIGNSADQLFFRSQNNGTWSGWYHGASREWASTNFIPYTGATANVNLGTRTITAPTFIGNLTGNASSVAWAGVSGKPSTLTGYGITDGATQTSVATLDANVVHKAGNETIAGVKLFSTSVGIGTTNVHSYKLAVGGGIIAESVKVKPQGGWPDYVFEKDYPILPLNELELFVLKNKHLPDVPNAAEVKKDGIELGEMNAKLLQKIEELTLYIIDQQNEMKKLSEVVGKLSAEMNSIKNK